MSKKNSKDRRLAECSEAVAEAVRLCKPGVIATYPITPQTHIVEKLSELIADGKLKTELIDVESEHSAMSACIGAEATGVRTFTASCSQGLALMSEMLFIASGLRLPVVMAVAARALSAPINIWGDHSDVMAQRDSGWLQFFCETAQEAHDTVIQAYKISESRELMLPSMVCIDGFTLSHLLERVNFLNYEQVKNFLPDYIPLYKLDPTKPITMGAIAYPNSYIKFKKQQQDAMEKSLKMIKGVNSEFRKKFSRSYGNGLIETYKIEDATAALVALGSICGTAKVVIDKLRKRGKKIGLVRLRAFRPFPSKEIVKATEGIKTIAVIDRAVSFGNVAPLYTEIKSILKDDINVKGFIAGLGGRDITENDIARTFTRKGGWII